MTISPVRGWRAGARQDGITRTVFMPLYPRGTCPHGISAVVPGLPRCGVIPPSNPTIAN